MALARDTVAEHIKPQVELGARVFRAQLGATTEAGEIITLQSDGKWDPTAATSVALTTRIAVKGGVDTDWVDTVAYGPVVCLTGATIGGLVYASDTAGEPSHTAGTKSTIVGYAQTATILFVQPQIVNLT